MDLDQLKKLVKQFYEVLAEDEFTDVIVKAHKNIFDKLLLAGFTRSEAMQIIQNLQVK